MHQTANNRNWIIKSADEAAVRGLVQKTGVDDLIARLLVLRGVEADQVAGFLEPTLKEFFPDPASFEDMRKGARIIWDALQAKKRIAVFADYDVDGATSASQLIKYARYWDVELDLYVPDRLEEGYGPSPEAFQKLKDRGAEVVITVDCGAAAREALEAGADIGLEIVVIDHHLMSGAIPPASALINPNRPDCKSGQGHLAAAGVVFVFLAAMNQFAREEVSADKIPDLRQWLDLCALGTLCDMAPLQGVNRAFVRQGMKVMAAGQTVGLRALADVASISVPKSVMDATFGLGPRLNAGGRIGDPWIASKLLASEDRKEAIALAECLHELNQARRDVEAEILDRATIMAEQKLARDPDTPVLIAAGEGWHPGVIGIVAGRLKDKFQRPSIVIGWGQGLGPVAKGSARSVTGVNIGDAITRVAKSGVILSGGGHAMAGGLSLHPDQLKAFEAAITQELAGTHKAIEAARDLEIDLKMSLGGLSRGLYEQIHKTGPFGAGAPEPVMLLKRVQTDDVRRIGTNHLKFFANDDTGTCEVIAWRAADTEIETLARSGNPLSLVGRLQPNDWRGKNAVQFELIDVAISSENL